MCRYEVREHLGMVFLWFDAEGRLPSWELEEHRDVADPRRFYFGASRQM
jgi:hypothetical protein